jgi:hypothetical protein
MVGCRACVLLEALKSPFPPLTSPWRTENRELRSGLTFPASIRYNQRLTVGLLWR